MTHQSWRRPLFWSAGVACTFVLVMTLGHTRPGMQLYLKATRGAACPLGGQADRSLLGPPVVSEAMKRALRAPGHAAQLFAKDFRLNTTSRSDVLAWAAKQAFDCRTIDWSYEVECSRQPAERQVTAVHRESLLFAFDQRAKLTRLRALTYFDEAQEATKALLAARDKASTVTQLAPTLESGQANSAYLQGERLRQVAYQMQAENFYSRISATYIAGPNPFLVTQHYQAL